MKIAIDARMIQPYETGVGRYLIKLAQLLPDIPGNETYHFIISKSLPADHPIKKINHPRLKLQATNLKTLDVRSQWEVPRELIASKPALFHNPHFDLPFLVPGKAVITIHDLKYIAHPDYFPNIGRIKRFLMWSMMFFAVRRAKMVIAVSENTRMDIIRYLNADPRKIKVTHLGVDSKQFQSQNDDQLANSSPSLPFDNPYLLFVGERRPHKNIVGLIQAFDRFRLLVEKPYHLVIAGMKYGEYDEPESVVEQYKLQDLVHFLDYIPDDDLPDLYKAAQAVVFLSHYEGFGLIPLEAMAAGVPVVAANTTSLPEAVGDAGILVPPGDYERVARAICDVIPGGIHRQGCIARGIERVKQFSWEENAHSTLEVYREALQS
jgi:glycosyltransferase involved in cell wall biosynthesis